MAIKHCIYLIRICIILNLRSTSLHIPLDMYPFWQVAFTEKSLKSDDVFVLDKGLEIIQWNGAGSNGMEKIKVASFTLFYHLSCMFYLILQLFKLWCGQFDVSPSYWLSSNIMYSPTAVVSVNWCRCTFYLKYLRFPFCENVYAYQLIIKRLRFWQCVVMLSIWLLPDWSLRDSGFDSVL